MLSDPRNDLDRKPFYYTAFKLLHALRIKSQVTLSLTCSHRLNRKFYQYI